MNLRSIHKVLCALLVLLLLGVGSIFGYMWVQAYKEYQNFKIQEHRLQEQACNAQEEYDGCKSYLTRFFKEPSFCEWVARHRLGYAGPDELVFHFSE